MSFSLITYLQALSFFGDYESLVLELLEPYEQLKQSVRNWAIRKAIFRKKHLLKKDGKRRSLLSRLINDLPTLNSYIQHRFHGVNSMD